MQALINGNFKILYKGDQLIANEDKDEFILDTECCDYSRATLIEIAKANDILLKKEDQSKMLKNLEIKINNLKHIEEKKMTEVTVFENIVVDGFAAEKSDDEIMIQMVEEGASFREASRLFNRIVEDKGLRISAKKRKEAIQEKLEEAEFAAEDYAAVEAMAAKIADELPDTTEKQVIASIRKYCKELEIEFPKAPKKAKGGLLQRFLKVAVENPMVTDEELTDWLAENSNKDQADVEKWFKRNYHTVDHGRRVAKAALQAGEALAPVEA